MPSGPDPGLARSPTGYVIHAKAAPFRRDRRGPPASQPQRLSPEPGDGSQPPVHRCPGAGSQSLLLTDCSVGAPEPDLRAPCPVHRTVAVCCPSAPSLRCPGNSRGRLRDLPAPTLAPGGPDAGGSYRKPRERDRSNARRLRHARMICPTPLRNRPRILRTAR